LKQLKYLIRLIKNIVLLLINYPLSIFIKKLTNSFDNQNYILIVKPDNLGDYILFRNFFPYIKEYYKEKKIIYCGNIVCKDIAEELDSTFIDEFIWFDKHKFKRNIAYKIKTLLNINKYSYEIALYPVLTREFFVGDIIMKSLNANSKNTSKTLDCYMLRFLQNISQKYIYDKIIDIDEAVIFEFYRNKSFVEKFLNCKIEIDKPKLSLLPSNDKISESKYAILFIGGSEEFRRWETLNYIDVAKYINDKYHLKCLFCGLKSDLKKDIEFYKFDNYGINLIDKTNIMEFTKLVANAELLITNDTVAQHIAVSVDTFCIVVSNGNDYGRFIPYPKEMTKKYSAVFHPEILNSNYTSENLKKRYGYTRSKLNINDISVLAVTQTIDKVLG